MGKIRTRLIGLENIEEQQKKDQKERALRKKAEKATDEETETKVEEVVTKKQPKDAKSTKSVKTRGKKYTQAKNKLDLEKLYTVDEAVEHLKKAAYAKFAESVEVHLNLLKDGLKGEIELPFSTGKTVRVAIVSDEIIKKLEDGVIDFDILITHPSFMPKIAKFARTLGPKGLMPNPKVGTVSANPEEVAKKFQKGTLRWKAEPKAPLIHQMVAKLPSEPKEIAANIIAFIQSVGKKNIKDAFVKSTMSPALKINMETIE